MIDESRLAALPSVLLREVRRLFPEETSHVYFWKRPPCLVVEFPGQHEVGDILVTACEMGDEIIVYLGHSHRHFTWYGDIDLRGTGYDQIVSEALDYVHRFMCGELILKVIFLFKRKIWESVSDAKEPMCHSFGRARRTRGFFSRFLGVWEVRKLEWSRRLDSSARGEREGQVG